jgi:hypothetical protein
VMGVENDLLKISWSRPFRSSSSGMHGVPCSSRTEWMPSPFRCFVSREATPQSSTTESPAMSASRRPSGTESQWQTPSKAGLFFAHLLASFARVLVPAIPTQTGTPTFRRTAVFMVWPSRLSSSGVPVTPRKASSML